VAVRRALSGETLALLGDAGLAGSLIGGGLGLHELTLGVFELLLIRLELGEESGLLEALLLTTLTATLPRGLLTIDERVEGGLHTDAHELHPAPGDAAELEEGVLGSDDERGNGECRDEHDGAHGGE